MKNIENLIKEKNQNDDWMIYFINVDETINHYWFIKEFKLQLKYYVYIFV